MKMRTIGEKSITAKTSQIIIIISLIAWKVFSFIFSYLLKSGTGENGYKGNVQYFSSVNKNVHVDFHGNIFITLAQFSGNS